VLDVERLAVDFLCNAVGNIMQVTAVDVFASEQIRGEVHCISGIQRWNVSLVQIIDCGSGDSGGGEFGQNVVDTDGSCEDDAEAGVFNAEAADGIEHLCGDSESFVAADAVEHPGDFIPEEHEFFCLTGFVEVSDGRVEQLFPCATFEVDVISFVVFEPSLYEVFSASGGAEELLNVVVDEFSKFECRVDFFKVVEDGFPAGFWLLQHFAEDLRFACSSFAGLEDGLGLEGLPEEFDEVVASVDVLWLEVSAGVGFHGSGLWGVVFCVEAVGVAGVLLWELWGSVCSVSIVKCVLCEICFVREAAGLAPAGASGGGEWRWRVAVASGEWRWRWRVAVAVAVAAGEWVRLQDLGLNDWTFSSWCPGVAPAFIAILPPSSGMMAPVIQAEASEASSRAMPRMSSGCPSRLAGMPLRKRASSCGSSAMRAWRLGLTT
jgi:hypothetical protein